MPEQTVQVKIGPALRRSTVTAKYIVCLIDHSRLALQLSNSLLLQLQ